MVLQKISNGHQLPPRDEVGIYLNILLATTLDLHSHFVHACWRARQMQDKEFVLLFSETARIANLTADEIAESICSSGRAVHGTAREVFQQSALPDYPIGSMNCPSHCEALKSSIAALARQIHKIIDRSDTTQNYEISDLLVRLSRRCETMTESLDQKPVHIQ